MGRLLFFVPRVRQPAALGPSSYLLDLLTGGGEEAGRLGHEFHLVTRESIHRLRETWDLAVGIVYPGDPWLGTWDKWRRQIPCVHLMTHPEPGREPDVSIDEDAAMDALVAHLFAQGIRRFAFLSVTHKSYSRVRLQAFLKAMKARDLPINPSWIPAYDPRGNLKEGHRAISDTDSHAWTTSAHKRIQGVWAPLMADPPQAVLCETDRLATVFLRHAEDQGIHVPGELLVSGFDDLAFQNTRGRVQSLTSIRQGLPRLARMAVRRAHDLFRGQTPAPPLRLKPVLVVRSSTLRPKPDHVGGEDFLPRCMERVTRHLDDPLVTRITAESFDLTVPYFLARFRSVSGRGFKDELTRLRLTRACELLAETKLSITEIHHACGYQSHQAFNRAFRAFAGKTAGDFRARGLPPLKGQKGPASLPSSD